MNLSTYDIEIRQGDSWFLGPIIWKAGNTALDLTTFDLKCEIKTSPSSASVVAQAAVNVLDAAKGTFTLSLTADQTEAMVTKGRTLDDATKYFYSVKISSKISSFAETIMAGTFSVYPEVTK